MGFQKATKRKAKLRLALTGPAGAGKTYTALSVASHLGGKIALVDTEHGSASKYADADTPTGQLSSKAGLFAFDVDELEDFHPQRYIDAIASAIEARYDVLILDSLSHAWSGKGGALDLHDAAVAQQRSPNKYTAWGDVTKIQNQLIEAIISAPLHIIATMRSKMEYAQEGQKVVKLGMAPVQRDGVEYEFDIVGDLAIGNKLVISKTRCPALKGLVDPLPGRDLAKKILLWLDAGVEELPRQQPAAVGAQPAAIGNHHTNGQQPPPAAKKTPKQQLEAKVATMVAKGHPTARDVFHYLDGKATGDGKGPMDSWNDETWLKWAAPLASLWFKNLEAADGKPIDGIAEEMIGEQLALFGKKLEEVCKEVGVDLNGRSAEQLVVREYNLLYPVLFPKAPASVPEPSNN